MPRHNAAAVVPSALHRRVAPSLAAAAAPAAWTPPVALPHRLPPTDPAEQEAGVYQLVSAYESMPRLGSDAPLEDWMLRFHSAQFTPAPAPAQNPSPPPQGDSPRLPPMGPLPVENTLPIDLAGALSMTAGQNPQVAFAQAQISEAFARWRTAEVLWLPSIRVGGNYNKHEGQIQNVEGIVFPTSRGALYTGLGAGAVGAGTVPVPGLAMQFHLADAIFQPKIAGSAAQAQQYSATATLNDQLLETALAYLALLDALQRKAIADETVANMDRLAELTLEYARAGQGTQADADRAAAAAAVQRNRRLRAEEDIAVASARLAQQLSLDASVCLVPQDLAVIPIDLCPGGGCAADLISTALANRPELAASQYLVSEAIYRLDSQQKAPWLPSVLLGASYGGFGGGLGGDIKNFDDRFDFDARAFWEVRGLGFGEQAARAEARARIDQATFRQVRVMDVIAREVAEGHAQVEFRGRQIAIAEQGVQAALDSHRRNFERIRELQGLPIEALQSIQALDEARREYLRSVIDYNQAQFRLHRALGWPVP